MLNNVSQQFLTVKDAISHSRLSRTTIWKLIRKGKLRRATNTGRRVLIALEELNRCLTEYNDVSNGL
jgi:excisionase family DNA binding protein